MTAGRLLTLVIALLALAAPADAAVLSKSNGVLTYTAAPGKASFVIFSGGPVV